MKTPLFIALFFVASVVTLAQRDGLTITVSPGASCPSGWTTANQTSTTPAKIFYVLPDALATASRPHERWLFDTVEILVTPTFVDSAFPTTALRNAAYASGRLRAEAASTVTARTCSLGA